MKPVQIPFLPEIDWLPERIKAATIKYGWAVTHIPKLNEVLEAFEDSKPWSLEQSTDLAAGMVRIRINQQPPKEIGLILGDIVHSLRSSLDYAVCGLVSLADPNANLRKVQFPFGDLGKPLNSADRAPLKSIKDLALPYIEAARSNGGEYLDVLNRVSNQDKHRLIVFTILRRMPMKVQINCDNNTADIIPDIDDLQTWMRPIQDGDVVEMGSMLALRPGFHIEDDSTPYALAVINQMFVNTHLALAYMIKAAEVMLSAQGLPPQASNFSAPSTPNG